MCKQISYERINLITPANREHLLADLRERTGLPIKRVDIGCIDFVRDIAEITMYYDEPATAEPTAPQLLPKAFQPRQQQTLES